MAATFTDEGLLVFLKHIVGQNIGTLKVRLMKNNAVLGAAMQLADVQECDFANYAPALMSGIVTLPNVADPVVATGFTPTLTFQQGAIPSNQNVFGYYVTQDINGQPVKLVAAEKFPDPVPLQQPNQAIRISVGTSVRRRA